MSDAVADVRSAQLNAAIVAYFEAIQGSEPLELESFLGQHADVAGELREYLVDHGALQKALPRLQVGVSTDGAEGTTGSSSREAHIAANVPRKFGHFELLAEIARGGMGVVYKARQTTPQRIVALKMILAGQLASQADIDRFHAETHAAAGLDHPNIVPIYEVGACEGQHYFTMALVEGESLAQRLANGPLPSPEAARVVREAALAVEFAHQHGVIHRDLKPANILIDFSGRARVTDFGLAKRQTDESGLTCTGQLLGTPSFMAPEQVRGEQTKIGPASDVYSLGATLYSLLTGRPPCHAASTVETLKQVLNKEPVPPRQLNLSISRDLETVILKCLEKDASRRYASARDFADDLERHLDNRPILARSVSRAEHAWRWCGRNPVVATLSGVAVALLIAAVTILMVSNARIRSESSAVRKESARSQQTTRFLTDMLAAAGPSVARGRDATLLREILDSTALRVESELKDQPEVQADLWYVIGRTYVAIGDRSLAIPALQDAANGYRLAFGEDNAKLAMTLTELGESQSFAGDVGAGRANVERAVRIARRIGDREILAYCLYGLAMSLDTLGRGTVDGIPYVREALKLYEEMGGDPLRQAKCRMYLANHSDDIDANIALSRDALDMRRQLLPPDHPDVAESVFMLGQALMYGKRAAEAEPVLRETVELYEKLFDHNYPHQSIVLRFYIESLIMQGKWDEAEATLREKMAKHPNSSTYWVFLAGAYSCRDDYAKAVEYFARAVEINPGNVYASFPLAVALCKAGRRDEYQRVCHECLVRLGSPDPAAIPSGLVAMALLAPVGGADFDRACELAERLPIDDADVFGYWKLATKALAALRQSRFKSAKEWAQRAIAFRGSLPRCQAQAWFIDAAASAELHDLGAARVSLQRGDDLAEEHNSGLYLGVLRDRDSWVIAGILREQAAERIAEMDSAAAESTPDRHR